MTRIKDIEGLRAYMVKIPGEDSVYIAGNMLQAEEEAYRIQEELNPGEMVDKIVFLGFVENDDKLEWKESKL